MKEARQDLDLNRWRSVMDNAQLAVENAAKAVLALIGPGGALITLHLFCGRPSRTVDWQLQPRKRSTDWPNRNARLMIREWSPEEIAAARENLRRRQEAAYRAREERRARAAQALRDAARQVFPRFPAVRRAYLFGSATQPGGMGPQSDVDVAVEGKLSAEDYFALWRALEEESGQPIDLVELTEDLPFAHRVREQGEILYERGHPNAESGDRG